MQRETTTTKLLAEAKQLIQSGEKSLRAAVENMAAAHSRGASQRQIADAVGRSPGWVNQLLQWRQGGYVGGTAFGMKSKASRQRAKAVQSTEQKEITAARETVTPRERTTPKPGELLDIAMQFRLALIHADPDDRRALMDASIADEIKSLLSDDLGRTAADHETSKLH